MPKLALFHASPYAEISCFHPGSHFGTREAALERAGARKFDDMEMTLYEVKVNISKPLSIFDEGGSHSLEYIASAVRSADRKALNVIASDHILRLGDTEGERAGFDCLYKFLSETGKYDGLKYKNTTEGREEFSWVIFRPDQAEIISFEPIQSEVPTLGR
jgi:hypothetical protein